MNQLNISRQYLVIAAAAAVMSFIFGFIPSGIKVGSLLGDRSLLDLNHRVSERMERIEQRRETAAQALEIDLQGNCEAGAQKSTRSGLVALCSGNYWTIPTAKNINTK